MEPLCGIDRGIARSMWDCGCPECSELQHDFNTEDGIDCGCPKCEPGNWADLPDNLKIEWGLSR